MITSITQTQTLSSISNVKLPRPRMQNKVGLNQQTDTFTPSFCANSEHLSTKLGGFLEKLFTPLSESSESLQHFKELNANIPSGYKF